MKNKQPNVTVARDPSSETRSLGVLLVGAGAIAGPYMQFIRENRALAVGGGRRSECDGASGGGAEVWSRSYQWPITAKSWPGRTSTSSSSARRISFTIRMVTSALKAGKHVICEKPLAITVAEADDMLDTAARHNKTLLVTMNMYFSPWAVGIRKLLGEKKLGTVFMAQSSYLGYEVARLRDPHDWKGDLQKAGGGVLAGRRIPHCLFDELLAGAGEVGANERRPVRHRPAAQGRG